MLTFLLSIADESQHDKIKFIYREFRGDMLKYAKYIFRRSGNKYCDFDVEDAVQNAFYKITLYIEAIDFTRSEKSIKSYCLSIVANEVSDILEDRFGTDEYEDAAEIVIDEDSIDNILSSVASSYLYEQVVKRIKKLKPKYANTLMYRYYHNMSVKEIADMMGISEQTVYTRLRRGMDKLHELLEEDNIHGNV